MTHFIFLSLSPIRRGSSSLPCVFSRPVDPRTVIDVFSLLSFLLIIRIKWRLVNSLHVELEILIALIVFHFFFVLESFEAQKVFNFDEAQFIYIFILVVV